MPPTGWKTAASPYKWRLLLKNFLLALADGDVLADSASADVLSSAGFRGERGLASRGVLAAGHGDGKSERADEEEIAGEQLEVTLANFWDVG